MSRSIHYPEDWDDCPRDERKALVFQCPKGDAMEYLRHMRRSFPEYYLIPWGSALMGMRFAEILVLPFVSDSSAETKSARMWRNHLNTRLYPGGRIRDVTPD